MDKDSPNTSGKIPAQKPLKGRHFSVDVREQLAGVNRAKEQTREAEEFYETEPPMEHEEQESAPVKKRFSQFRSFFFELVIIAILAIVIRLFVLGLYNVPTGSMLQTIQEGDLIVGEKITGHFTGPTQGQIVTFEDPRQANTTLVKRVIATAGQTIDLQDGKVLIDNKILDEPYTNGEPTQPLNQYSGAEDISYPYTVPEGHVWVMGDNRTNSLDSRFFGSIPVSSISSKIFAVYWPLDQIRLL